MKGIYINKSIVLAVSFFVVFGHFGFASNEKFVDVPVTHWSYEVVHQLKAIGVTEGIAPGVFGLEQKITRAEFITFLVRLMAWDKIGPDVGNFDDVASDMWHFTYVETAFAKDVIDKRSVESTFRPDEPITREEMALMIINTLGQGMLAQSKDVGESGFLDVDRYSGEIALLKDFGIVDGVSATSFAPKDTARREEAAAVLMRMNDILEKKINLLNGFYAINGYDQLDMVTDFSTISFAWSNLTYDEDTGKVGLEVKEPVGKVKPIELASSHNIQRYMTVYGAGSMVSDLLENKNNQSSLIEEIVALVNEGNNYQGVVIDFEEIKGAALKPLYNDFLDTLKMSLNESNKSLTVMLHPIDYYKGYDYKHIGEVADHVILMAHDYNAKVLTENDRMSGYTYTPVAPIGSVYRALKDLTDVDSGVNQRSKISLQVSFAVAQWGQDEAGYVVNAKPYTPTYQKLYARLVDEETEIGFDEKSQNPYASYFNEDDGLRYTIWYEDSRSVDAKIRLAQLFGINNISLWRLGNIPDYRDEQGKKVHLNVMSRIINTKIKSIEE